MDLSIHVQASGMTAAFALCHWAAISSSLVSLLGARTARTAKVLMYFLTRSLPWHMSPRSCRCLAALGIHWISRMVEGSKQKVIHSSDKNGLDMTWLAGSSSLLFGRSFTAGFPLPFLQKVPLGCASPIWNHGQRRQDPSLAQVEAEDGYEMIWMKLNELYLKCKIWILRCEWNVCDR